MQKIKDRLQDIKEIKVSGMKFKIRRLNPLLDFTLDRMPQIFTDFISRRKIEDPTKTIPELMKIQRDVYTIIEAAVLEPELMPIGEGDKRGKENGITVEDLFRDPDMGYRLYMEIMNHSLFRFKGLRGLFFSIKIKYLAYMAWRKSSQKPLSSFFSLIIITVLLKPSALICLSSL